MKAAPDAHNTVTLRNDRNKPAARRTAGGLV